MNESTAAWRSTGYAKTIMNVNLNDLYLKYDGLTESLGKEPMRRNAVFVYQSFSETT